MRAWGGKRHKLTRGLVYGFLWSVTLALVATSSHAQPASGKAKRKAAESVAQATEAPKAPVTLNPQWFGTWRAASGETLRITATHMGHDAPAVGANNQPTRRVSISAWSDDLSQARAEVPLFAYSGARLTDAQVRAHAATAAAASQALALEAAAALPPGRYRVVQEVMAGACATSRYVVADELLLRLSTCQERVAVELFRRTKP
jgi:hypothetical protein